MTNSKHHTIDLQGLSEFMNTESVKFAYSSKEKKEIRLYLNGAIKVFHEGVKVWEGIQPYNAVEVYNSIK